MKVRDDVISRMTDMIYRQDAINAANRSDYRGLTVEDVVKVTDVVVEELKQLPSAQPEIIRCTECEYYDATTEHCTNDKGLRFIDYSNPDGMWCAWAERREE